MDLLKHQQEQLIQLSQAVASLRALTLFSPARKLKPSDDVPVRQRYRRIPPSEYEALKAHINQLLESQVIREGSSPYASPIVLVRKMDGSLRLCVDYL